MRPIEKPACPTVAGAPKVVTEDYKLWKADLEQAIGMFCTYCGMRLNNSPQVEHVVPQNPISGNPAGNPFAWDNVVFSCQPCNGKSGKSNKNYNAQQHYMPEQHNTLLPFIYPHAITQGHLIVEAANGLSNAQRTKAIATINLFNFQHIDQREAKVDYRSSERWQAKQTVDTAFGLYAMAKASPTFDEDIASTVIARLAVSTGFFQLWVEAFINEPEVLKKLIHPDFFPGTHQASFDPVTGQPRPRNPGNPDPF